jgi:hypothetical protein
MTKWLTLGLIFFLSHSALAALGGDEASIEAELKMVNLSKDKISNHGKYTLHEIAPKKFKLHEFMGSNGKVFAVAWCGKGRPDPDSVLGDHIEDFKNAIKKAKSGPHGRRGAVVDQGNFHLELSGHGMFFCGRAWLASQIPEGVTTDELR